MKTQLIMIVALAALLGCEDKPAGGTPGSASGAGASSVAAATAQKVEAPRPVRAAGEKTVVDVALDSKDHTTLVAALKSADLVESLDSPGGVYTVFAPTNEAFDKLPKGTVEELLKPEKHDELRRILQHHAGVPVMQLKDMKDGMTMAMADGTKVTFHVKDGKVMVNDVHILATISAMNGIVHVVDGVILPPPAK